MSTRVVNVKVEYLRKGKADVQGRKYDNLKEWCEADPDHVYIGRASVVFVQDKTKKERYPKEGSILGNPFKIGPGMDRDRVCDAFASYLRHKMMEDPELKEYVLSLKGKTLGCWCHPERCHGDEIVKIITEEEELAKALESTTSEPLAVES